MKQSMFLSPGSERTMGLIRCCLDELQSLEGEKLGDAEEALAAMTLPGDGEEVRRLRKELLHAVTERKGDPRLGTIDPEELRIALFASVWSAGQPTGMVGDDLFSGDREGISRSIGRQFDIDAARVPEALFADTPAEQRVSVPQVDNGDLAERALREVNLERLKQALRRAVRLTLELPSRAEPGASYVTLLWGAKRLGLMYEVSEGIRSVTLDVFGPYGLFSRTTMYGNRLFDFSRVALGQGGREWSMRVELLTSVGVRTTALGTLRLDASMRSCFVDDRAPAKLPMRSGDEEAFRNYFSRAAGGWKLDYEGAILVAGDRKHRVIMVPDFVARRENPPAEAFIEIVGFWKRDYLERKMAKAGLFRDRRLMLIVNSKLAVSREDIEHLERTGVRVFFYAGRQALKNTALAVAEELSNEQRSA
jgi:predicted nuclease of restriction endonuclease-like RecB superfamily